MITWQKQPLKEAGNELGIIGLWFLAQYLTLMLTKANKLGDRGREGWQQASRREIAVKHRRSPACESSTCVAPISHSRDVSWSKEITCEYRRAWLQTEALGPLLLDLKLNTRGRKMQVWAKWGETPPGGLPRAWCPLYGWDICAWPPAHLLAKA